MLPGHWFTRYAILGDDILIAHRGVAEIYVSVMNSLGVGIGLAKSLISPFGVAEFAKRFFTPSDASPISLREVGVALHSSSNLLELALKRASLGKISMTDVFAFLGYGYRVRGSIEKSFFRHGKRVRNWLLMLTHPDGP